jgi:signal peptidase I
LSGANPVHPLGRRHLHVIWLGVVVLIALIAGLLLRSAWQRVYQITSPTMADTLLVGDYVTVDNSAYRVNPPRRSDIVLLEYPFQFLGGKMQWLSQIFTGLVTRTPPERLVVVRRIVGMPGETVAITNNQVIVDGVALKEPYRRGEAPENVPAVEVPPGFYYVLCDNRALGPDSREFGPIEQELLRGRVGTVVWSEIPTCCPVPWCGGDLRPAGWDELPLGADAGDVWWKCKRDGEVLRDWWDARPFKWFAPWQSLRWDRLGTRVESNQKD